MAPLGLISFAALILIAEPSAIVPRYSGEEAEMWTTHQQSPPPCVTAETVDYEYGCDWWYHIESIGAKRSDEDFRLAPILVIDERTKVCPPFPAFDNDGHVSSGIDPDWPAEELCRELYKGAALFPDFYTRTVRFDDGSCVRVGHPDG